jgi:hypothetical protein
VIVENTEFEPGFPSVAALLTFAPPPPTVIGYVCTAAVIPVLESNGEAVYESSEDLASLNPPAPPPPAPPVEPGEPPFPPLAPPPITKYESKELPLALPASETTKHPEDVKV